jgi:hypothetical protein
MKHDISEDMTLDELFNAIDALESVCYNLHAHQEDSFNSPYSQMWTAMNTAYKWAYKIKEDEEIKEFQDSSLTTKAG